MPLPAKRKSETGAPKKAKSKIGMVSADSGTGAAKSKLNRPVGGLSAEQMSGGGEPEVGKKAKPKTRPKTKPKSSAY